MSIASNPPSISACCTAFPVLRERANSSLTPPRRIPIRFIEIIIAFITKQKSQITLGFLLVCAGRDLNPRSPKASDLQSDVIDHSTTDASVPRKARDVKESK